MNAAADDNYLSAFFCLMNINLLIKKGVDRNLLLVFKYYVFRKF